MLSLKIILNQAVHGINLSILSKIAPEIKYKFEYSTSIRISIDIHNSRKVFLL